jgi:hypothetical protein
MRQVLAVERVIRVHGGPDRAYAGADVLFDHGAAIAAAAPAIAVEKPKPTKSSFVG